MNKSSQFMAPKQNFKNSAEGNSNQRKRDQKNRQVKVLQDEDPLKGDILFGNQPSPANGIIYQVAPANANCVN